MPVMTKDGDMTQPNPTRERILRVAGELFYNEGIRTAGVDLIAERAGVTKQTLYRYFHSKEDLIAAYLSDRDVSVRRWLVKAATAKASSAADVVAALFATLGKWFDTEEFRGCSFLNAAVQSAPSNAATLAIAKLHKDRMHDWLAGIFEEEKRPNPSVLASKIMILLDGSIAAALAQGNKRPAILAEEVAQLLLENSPPERPRKRSPGGG